MKHQWQGLSPAEAIKQMRGAAEDYGGEDGGDEMACALTGWADALEPLLERGGPDFGDS